MNDNDEQTRTAAIRAALPYLRRHGRALTGSQEGGDGLAAAALELLLDSPDLMEMPNGRIALFRALHRVWSGATPDRFEVRTGLEGRVQDLLNALAPLSREALLLSAVEGFPQDQIAEILEQPSAAIPDLLAQARQDMHSAIKGKVLVIEDEAIIALDLRNLTSEMGQDVIGIARTRDEAVALAANGQPDLILADINLADGSSGIDAVNDIQGEIGARQVVFITAYPERLLTGDRPEPAFLITKPYSEDQVLAAVGQAMFFASTAFLKNSA